MQDPENADPNRPAGSPSLSLHAFDLDLHKWSTVHTTGSVPFQKLQALHCTGDSLIAVGWSAVSGKSDGDMQVCLAFVPRCRRVPCMPSDGHHAGVSSFHATVSACALHAICW